MKKTFLKLTMLAVITSVLLSSCATILSSKQKTYGLVDVPVDLKIKNLSTGEELTIIDCALVTDNNKSFQGTQNVGDRYWYYSGKGVKMKVKKNTKLEFTSGGVSKIFEVGGKGNTNSFGYIWLDIMFTAGIGVIVDVSTGALKWPNPYYIDVSSLFADKPQRTKKELEEYIRKVTKKKEA